MKTDNLNLRILKGVQLKYKMYPEQLQLGLSW